MVVKLISEIHGIREATDIKPQAEAAAVLAQPPPLTIGSILP
jgi:hypothetical protein